MICFLRSWYFGYLGAFCKNDLLKRYEAEAHSESSQTTKMGLLPKKVNSFMLFPIFAKRYICLGGFWMRLWEEGKFHSISYITISLSKIADVYC